MGGFRFWQRWLFTTTLVVTGAGVGLALFGGTLLTRVLDPAFHMVFWGDQPIAPPARAYQAWIYGVLGATLAGWGTCLAFLVQQALAHRESWAHWAIGAGLVVWFVPDTALSYLAGVYANVLLNCLILAALGLPLLMTWRAREDGPAP